MQAYAVTLIAFGSAIASLIILCCPCNIGSNNNNKKAVTASNASTKRKDVGMNFLARAGSAVATSQQLWLPQRNWWRGLWLVEIRVEVAAVEVAVEVVQGVVASSVVGVV